MTSALLTEEDLAAHFKVGKRTVQKWREMKTGPDHIVIGKHTVRYRMEDIRAYEQQRLKAPSNDNTTTKETEK